MALAQAHNLLAAESWQHRLALEEVARKSVNGDANSRVRFSGPPVELEPRQAVTTAMALHEMYTNAVKHRLTGAEREQGSISQFEWQVSHDPDPLLVMRLVREWTAAHPTSLPKWLRNDDDQTGSRY